jgi:hypothetical protein
MRFLASQGPHANPLPPGEGTKGRWWTRGPTAHQFSLEARWLPMLALGGLLTALLAAAWRPGGLGLAPNAGVLEETPPTRTAAANDAGSADFHQLPAVRIRLRADAAGRLASIALDGRPVRDVIDLRSQIRAFLGATAGEATIEAELDCDGQLRYEETRRIIDTISTFPAADGRTMIPLVDRVIFSPRGTKQP